MAEGRTLSRRSAGRVKSTVVLMALGLLVLEIGGGAADERSLRLGFQGGEDGLPQFGRGDVRLRVPLDAKHPVVSDGLDGFGETVVGAGVMRRPSPRILTA